MMVLDRYEAPAIPVPTGYSPFTHAHPQEVPAIDFTGFTIRFDIRVMRGQCDGRKNVRSAVCLGHTSRGWVFIPVTSTWKAPFQTPIHQTGDGWTGWDLRYSRPSYWCPNRVMYLTTAEVQAALATDRRVGHAPKAVVSHGLREMRHAINNRLLDQTAWFTQPGLIKRGKR